MGLTSPFTAGEDITAAALAFVAPLAAFKYADFNAGPSNTTPVADPDLSLALAAGGVYTGIGMIVASAAANANYQATFTAPAGATGGWNPNLYIGSGGTGEVTNAAFLPFATTLVTAGQGTASNISFAVQFSVVMGATAGNLQYEFAQGTSQASNCNTRAGSFLLAWRVA